MIHRKLFLNTWVLAISALSAAVVQAQAPIVNIESQYLFAPKGFDDNDNAQIVLDGYLPSTCYKVASPDVKVDHVNKLITVTARASVYMGPCLLVLVPYTTVIDLGVLANGAYKVHAAGTETQTMDINYSLNSGPDDRLYAPVDDVKVTVEPENQRIYAEISGRFTNTCMSWDVSTVIDSSDTIQLMPGMIMQDRPDCENLEFAYKVVRVDLPWRGPGRYLLHTRGLNGKSANTAFSVYGE